MLKFLHSSDWHFGACRRLTPKSLDYLERHKKGLRAVLDVARCEKVDFILVSGDIFENASTTVEELLAAIEIFTEAGQIAPTIVTAGNHDELNVGHFQTKWLELLATPIPNVKFYSTPQQVELNKIKIAAIPWTGLKDQEQFNQLVSQASEGCEIVMLHECFLGIALDSGLTSKGGVKIPDLEHVRYWACGDIHLHQRVQLPNAYYSGAPMQYTFGDRLPRGCMVVLRDAEGVYSPKFISIPQAIELHNITSLDQIPKDSPHWYKLKIDAASMPKHLPVNVKDYELIPRKVDLPKPVLTTTETGEEMETMQVDFTEGIEEILLQNGFEKEEIKISKEEVLQHLSNL